MPPQPEFPIKGSSWVEIHGVTADAFETLKERLALLDAEFHDDGRVSGRGVQGYFSHDVDRSSLTLHIVQHPPIVTAGYILGVVYDALKAGRVPAVAMPAGA